MEYGIIECGQDDRNSETSQLCFSQTVGTGVLDCPESQEKELAVNMFFIYRL